MKHDEALSEIRKEPFMIHPEFVFLEKNIYIFKGQIDAMGRIGKRLVMLELKMENKELSSKSKAKRQLLKYSADLNYFLKRIGKKEINFMFCIVRYYKETYIVDVYDNEQKLREEQYTNGKGYHR